MHILPEGYEEYKISDVLAALAAMKRARAGLAQAALDFEDDSANFEEQSEAKGRVNSIHAELDAAIAGIEKADVK